MRVQFRPSLLRMRRTKTKFIIIHHTAEMYDNPSAAVDNAVFQSRDLLKGALEKKQPDVNYHFIVEKIRDDYQALMMRPYISLCDFDDIDSNINKAALHIGLLGDYNFKVPEKRLYEVLAYKIISPLIKTFALSPIRVKLHKDVSSNKECTCPGEFFDDGRLESYIRRFWMK